MRRRTEERLRLLEFLDETGGISPDTDIMDALCIDEDELYSTVNTCQRYGQVRLIHHRDYNIIQLTGGGLSSLLSMQRSMTTAS